MKKYQFTCKFLSEVVLNSTPATEGFHRSLDYVPGIKFLGIAARYLYDREDINSKELFHTGKIQFTNAYPLVGDDETFPIPYSWRKHKSLESPPQNVYVHGKIKDDATLGKDDPLQQMRHGYFSENGVYVHVSQNFSLKSAYDIENRRSQEGQMFGYHALPKNTQWSFYVKGNDEDLLDKVKEVLVGKHTIGRSRTAQYGMVEITYAGATNIESKEISAGEVWLYAQSDCAFFDDYGNPTFTPEPKHLGLPEGSTINWNKSQLRTRKYAQWNATMNARESERVVVEKGSVWVCNVDKVFNSVQIDKGVGAYLSDGLGQLIINPSFLQTDEDGKITFNLKGGNNHIPINSTDATPSKLVKWVMFLEKEADKTLDIEKSAIDFIDQNFHLFKGMTSSQWGHIKKSAKQFKKYDDLETYLFHKDVGYLFHGVNEKVFCFYLKRKIFPLIWVFDVFC